MRFFMRRVVASVTAALVFITTINCVCQGALLPRADDDCQHEKLAARPCCEHEHEHHHHGESPCKHDGSQDHDPACIHCQATVVTEAPAQTSFVHTFALSFDLPACGFDILAPLTDLRLHAHYFVDDLPPPLSSPTLLSLGCALNT
jgi:hypothetical protein